MLKKLEYDPHWGAFQLELGLILHRFSGIRSTNESLVCVEEPVEEPVIDQYSHSQRKLHRNREHHVEIMDSFSHKRVKVFLKTVCSSCSLQRKNNTFSL